MKNLKLFPKTFLVSIGLFAALIILVHALVYTLMPQFYLQQKEREAVDNLTALTTELRGKSNEEMRRLSQEFAQVKNVNITLTIDGRDQYFQGFQSINIVTDSGKSVDTSVVKIADGQTVDPRSVILQQGSVADNQGRTITVKLLADVAPVTQAKLATLHVLPYTMLGSLLVALMFSYIYSRFVTRPIRQMAAVTTTMQQLEKGAHYPVSSSDEIGVLGRNINELYQNLWQTIRSLEHENKRITQLEKEKIAFLRAASHELKTPLAALRIMLDGVVTAAVEAMAGLGADPAGLWAAIGPAICGSCYEVPERMLQEAAAREPACAALTRWGTPGLDIAAGVVAQLRRAGVQRIDRPGWCTYEDRRFYSHRRDGTTGRIVGAALAAPTDGVGQ